MGLCDAPHTRRKLLRDKRRFVRFSESGKDVGLRAKQVGKCGLQTAKFTMECPMIKPVTAACLIMSAIFGLIATHADAAPPIRLHFAPGSYGVMANGRVTASEPHQVYTFDANAGQTMIITLTGAGQMGGTLQGLGGGEGPYCG